MFSVTYKPSFTEMFYTVYNYLKSLTKASWPMSTVV